MKLQHKENRAPDLDFESIVEEYSDMVYRLAMKETGHRDFADDIYSEVFLRLYENLHRLREEEHAKPWLIRVTQNCSRTLMKQWKRENAPLLREVSDKKLTFSERELTEAYQAVISLPAKYSDVIHLYYYENISIEDISKLLRQSRSATKMQLTRAKEKLKSILGDDFDEAS